MVWLWATGRLRAVSHASHAPCTSGLALVMLEVQERKKKCPVTLNVSVHTHKSSLIPVDTSHHMAEPYISREGKSTLLPAGITAKSYAKVMDTGRASFRTCHPCRCAWALHSGGGPHLWLNALLPSC